MWPLPLSEDWRNINCHQTVTASNWNRQKCRDKALKWTFPELTDGLKWWPQVGVYGLKQVIVVKIQDKFFKVLQPLPMRWWAVTVMHVLIWGAEASWDAASTFGTMVVGEPPLIRAPLLLVLLSLNVCHLHKRYVLLSSSLQVEALLIQGFQLLNAVAHPGSRFQCLQGPLSCPAFFLCYSGCAKEPMCQHWKSDLKSTIQEKCKSWFKKKMLLKDLG